MNEIYKQLGFEDELDLVYWKDFPREKKKQVSKEQFKNFAKEIIKGGLPQKNFLMIMATSNFDLEGVAIVSEACNAKGSKISFECIEPTIFAVIRPEMIARLVGYINLRYQKEFVTGVLKRADLLPVGSEPLKNVNEWIEREEKRYENLENIWTSYFMASERESGSSPKVVVKNKSEYDSEEEYMADVIECLRGIEYMETYKNENIYAKAKSMRLGGYPRLERFIFHKTRASVTSAMEDRPVADYLNSD